MDGKLQEVFTNEISIVKAKLYDLYYCIYIIPNIQAKINYCVNEYSAVVIHCSYRYFDLLHSHSSSVDLWAK